MNGILLVGAYDGAELSAYVKEQRSPIVFIEADPDNYKVLLNTITRLKNTTGSLEVYTFNIAASSGSGRSKFYKTSAPQSHSLFPLGKGCSENYPGIIQNNVIEVETAALDDVLKNANLAPERFDRLVVDVQGAEMLVLKGATNVLKHVSSVRLEVSTQEMYVGGILLVQIDEFMLNHRFTRVKTELSMVPGIHGDAEYKKDGIMLTQGS